jgi:YidC/Oxa1 family membrane protein insertase
MDNIRVFLWGGLGLLLWISYTTWQQDYAAVQTSPVAAVKRDIDTGPILPSAAPDLPDLPDLPDVSGTQKTPDIAVPDPVATRPMIQVMTDVFDLRIDPQGGDIRSAKLLAYPFHKDQPDIPVTLLNPDPDALFVFRTGVRALDGAPEANHLSEFSAEQQKYVLAADEDELKIRLSWSGDQGITAEKIFTFTRGSYAIGMEQTVSNHSKEPYRAVSYLQIQRRHNPPEVSMFDVDSYSFTGPVVYDGDKYEKLEVDDLSAAPYEQSIVAGWIASIQHHFLAAAVPSKTESANYEASYDGRNYVLSAVDGNVTTIAPDDTGSFVSRLFVGPKLQLQLDATADGLTLTVDYGVFTVLSQPLFWLLKTIHRYIGNWGWTIIIVTMMIKLLFYKLTETSGRSMARMRKLQPRLKALQDRHKDDREALSKAMMDLYKREKVNPVAGCLPMLIQIPFFMAFYWVLLESVEMRQAPFMLWITDLSSRDPWFILPLLMGAAMYFQQQLNPPPPDPTQAKVMQFLPIMFTAMFAFFPAGLVLYWLTNSVLSMAQQWRINKVLGAD